MRVAVDTRPLLAEVNAMESLWLANTGRQSKILVQRETNSIFLRAADHASFTGQNINDIQQCVTTPHAANCPAIMRFLERFAEYQEAVLQRVLIVRLKPDGQVYPHVDRGRYYRLSHRYHLVLVSPAGSRLSSGDEAVTMQQGEVWWLQNKLVHGAQNHSNDWRIHVIFDLLPASVIALAADDIVA